VTVGILPKIETELLDLGLLFSLPLITILIPFRTKSLEEIIIFKNLITKAIKGLWYLRYFKCSVKKLEKSILE
jgi:hypothetical protein